MAEIQTEHLDNHTARLTVAVDPNRLDSAMRQAARQIAKKGRIPGFRPGKAPYDVVVRLFGREYVMSEALDKLGNDIYREVLDEAEIEPYAPGSLEDINEDDGLKLTFVVPLRPTVDLGDYRDLRLDYELEEVTDKMVDEAMENLRQNQAVVEDTDRAAQLGDQVTFGHFEVALLVDEDAESDEDGDEDEDDEAQADTPDEAEDDANSESEEHDHDHDDSSDDDIDRVLLHQHDYEFVLREGEDDMFPGFAENIVGANKGDTVVFELDIPEDYHLEDIAGRAIRCTVDIDNVQSRTVPEWSDALASSITDGEQETILELRVEVRKQLEENARRAADQDMATRALDHVVESATIKFPEELVNDYTDDLLAELDRNLQSQGSGLRLDDFMRITGRSEDDMRAEYRDRAIERAKRSLVLGQLVSDEQIDVDSAAIDNEINTMAESLAGGRADSVTAFKSFLMTPESRLNISSRMLTDRAIERLVAIAKGENPEIGMPPTPAAEADAAADDTAEADDETTGTDAPVDDTAPESDVLPAEASETEDTD